MTLVHGVELRKDRDRIALYVESGRGPFEPETIPVYVEAVRARPNTAVIDAGAYTGLFTILAIQAGAAEVHAFEPNPAAYERLLQNLEHAILQRRECARIYNAALSAFNGQGVMKIGDERLGICSTSKLTPGVHGPTKIRTIDGLARRYPVGVIKIDVEGHELSVLAGAVGVLERYHPLLIVEVNSGSGGDRTGIVTDFLSSFGYRGRPADGRNMIFEVPHASSDDHRGAPRRARDGSGGDPG